MARQLIFTSSPQGLEPGRTGYCTVARHKDLRSRLVRELERLSVYDFNQQGEGPKVEIATYRKLALGSEDYFVVSRIRDAGLDYTNRTNYIAHHLVLDSFEIASVPSPAEILANWNGWLAKWEGPARYLTEAEEADLSVCKSPNLIPANGWLAATNDPGNAATLVSPQIKKPVVLDVHPGQEESLLKLFAESCALIKLSLDAWDYSFTTFLQENEDSRGYAWIGSRGHPAGERAKQAAPNVIDLRDFSQSKITDPVDDDLAHVARKGPKAKAAGAKSPKTRAKAPGKAFSDREMTQYKQAASNYVSSGAAAPAGSTAAAPQSQGGSSSGKQRKKRPWLMQLIVISTALCLLVGLVVGVAYNLDDWMEEDEPGGGPDPVTPSTPSGPRPVVENASLNVGEPGTVKLVEKHRLLRWLKLDVGEPGGSPVEVTVNLTDDQQDAYLDLLDGVSPGDPIRVTVIQNGDDTLGFEVIEKAPPGGDVVNPPTPPDAPAGEPEEVAFTGPDSVSLQGNQASFELPGRGSVAYTIPDDRPEERAAVEALVAFVRENPTATAPIQLLRDEDGVVVGIRALDLPDPATIVEPVTPTPVGVPREVTVNDTQAVRFINNGESLAIRVGARTLSYAIPSEELERVRRLISFIEAGGRDVKLDLRVDGDVVRGLSFDLPEEAVAALTTGPVALVPTGTYVFWLPGRKLSEKPLRWELDLPRTGAVRYENPQVSAALFEVLLASGSIPGARVWRAPFSGPRTFFKVADSADRFESYALEVSRDRLNPENQARFSLKTMGPGGAKYFLELSVRRNGFIEVDFDYDLAKIAAENGFVLRVPRSNEACVDFHFLSNKHLSAENGHLPVPRASQLTLTGTTLRLDPGWPVERNFHVLVRGSGEEYELSLAPALGPSGEESRELLYAAGVPSAMAFIRGDVGDFPKAVVSPNSADRFACEVKVEVEYMEDLRKDFQRLAAHWEAGAQAGAANLPDAVVFKNLLEFGSNLKQPAFTPGEAYGPYLLNTVTSLARTSFQLDNAQTERFRKDLKVLDPQGFHLKQTTLTQFWRTCFGEMRRLAELPFRDFRYDPERAERDVGTIFRLMYFSVLVEKTFGLRDTDLARELKAFRDSFSQLGEGGLLGEMQGKLLPLRDTADGKKAIALYNSSNEQYLDFVRKSLPPPTNLTYREYGKAMEYLADATKAASLRKSQGNLDAQQQWLARLKAKQGELNTRFNAVMAAGGSQVKNVRSRMVSTNAWALALFRKGGAASGNTAARERVADIVTFR